jgi:transcriptional regulator with XRE-family HTH domain
MNHTNYTFAMQRETPATASSIVLWARLSMGMSQRQFAVAIGSHQSLICKYERGDVSPPADLVIHLMDQLGTAPVVSERELQELIESRLGGERMGVARHAVAQLIRSFPAGDPGGGSRKRRTG